MKAGYFWIGAACSVILCGCNQQEVQTAGVFSFLESSYDLEYIVNSVEIDWDSVSNIKYITRDSIIYYAYEGTGVAFYAYNREDNIVTQFGELSDVYVVNSADIAVSEENIYFYYNETVSGEDGGESLIQTLYEIDGKEDTLVKLAEDDSEQTLVYLEYAQGSIISYKGKTDGDTGIFYLDSYDLDQGSDGIFEILLTRTFDNSTLSGECIYQFAVYDEILYVLCCTEEAGEILSWSIELYKPDGTYMRSIEIDVETTQLLQEEMPSRFEVFGDCAYIGDFSNDGFLLDISGDVSELLFYRPLDVIVCRPYDTQDYDSILLCGLSTAELWRFDVQTRMLTVIDVSELGYESFDRVYIDGSGEILFGTDDNLLLGVLDDFPTEETAVLTGDQIYTSSP